MMMEPNLDRQGLIDAVSSAFGFIPSSVNFLPIGFDARSFSYECYSDDRRRFYLKLRLDDDPSDLFSTSLLVASQIDGAIHPIANRNDGLSWIQFGRYKLVMFPYVEGVPGWNTELSTEQWRQIGQTVRSLHDLVLPDATIEALPRENFSTKWRTLALRYLNEELPVLADDAFATAMRELLRTHYKTLVHIIERAQKLSLRLLEEKMAFVCCHGDLHSGNFIITESGSIHPVDWDNLSLAPREKDLMFVGGGIGGMLDAGNAMQQFARGYGPYQVRVDALRYFRLERIVQDVVAFCEQLLDSSEGGPERAVMFQQFSRQFNPGGVIDVALNT